ncbi:midnolin homolog [Macrosteles quadrilineatus]|uniref:midnolin homolog n=1 Tax=Macrosteles quadrilineatus TaxID=74068 RepID=UPI0023E19EE5|nr:midnolin homolog [Macrosteles quadrilineatus]
MYVNIPPNEAIDAHHKHHHHHHHHYHHHHHHHHHRHKRTKGHPKAALCSVDGSTLVLTGAPDVAETEFCNGSLAEERCAVGCRAHTKLVSGQLPSQAGSYVMLTSEIRGPSFPVTDTQVSLSNYINLT